MKRKKLWIFSLFLFLIFIIYTILVKYVDLAPIGASDTIVGFSSLNQAVKEKIGVNLTLYKITDIGSIGPLLLVSCFAILGLGQWIKRKSIKKVDLNLIFLGASYLVTLLCFIFFEIVIINYRPILIEGRLEASYPSSTTLLSLVVMLAAIPQIKVYVSKKNVRWILILLDVLYSLFLVIGRFFSGVHWCSDIIGSILLSSTIVLGYLACLNRENKMNEDRL